MRSRGRIGKRNRMVEKIRPYEKHSMNLSAKDTNCQGRRGGKGGREILFGRNTERNKKRDKVKREIGVRGNSNGVKA